MDGGQGGCELPSQSLARSLVFGLTQDPWRDRGALDEGHQHACGYQSPTGRLERDRLRNGDTGLGGPGDESELVRDRHERYGPLGIPTQSPSFPSGRHEPGLAGGTPWDAGQLEISRIDAALGEHLPDTRGKLVLRHPAEPS